MQQSNSSQALFACQDTHRYLALWILSGTNRVSRYRQKLMPVVVINRPLSASSIYYDPWHPPCSIHMPDSLYTQSLSKFSLVYLLAWYPPLHTPYISSPNHCLLFTTHAHTIATCFAVVPILYHLILVSLSQPCACQDMHIIILKALQNARKPVIFR